MFRDIFVGLTAVVGAALFSQLPEFMQQYLQRLGGHLDEARRLHETSPALAARVTDLVQAHDSLANADLLVRPYAFVRHLQPDIALNTLQIFRPALPLTLEGLVYAGAGMVVALLLRRLLLTPFRRRAAERQWQ